MATETIKVGPADHGRRMTLDDFDRAEKKEGYLYELGRGVIIVSDVPDDRHFGLVDALRQELSEYRATYRDQIYRIGGGSDCKVLLPDMESERHPDLAVYKKPAPKDKDRLWAAWVPEIVVEVISPGSEHRDYEQKREEYLKFGVREYWIVDADRREILILRRAAGAWKERTLRPGQVYRTRLLPDFELDCARVFEAAGQ